MKSETEIKAEIERLRTEAQRLKGIYGFGPGYTQALLFEAEAGGMEWVLRNFS